MQSIDHKLKEGGSIQVSHGRDLVSLVVRKDEYLSSALLTKDEVLDLCVDLISQSADLT